MSRRASFFAKLHPGKRRVRFPDEIVFEESIKESDGEAIMAMLRRASLDIDVNRINMAGMTALHQAVLDGNIVVIRLLLIHGADINKRDADSWTPLHAAAANGNADIVRYLLTQGADRDLLTEDGETTEDLLDPDDEKTLEVLQDKGTKDKRRHRMSLQEGGMKEPAAWFRRESLQEERKRSGIQDPGRKCSAWVQGNILEEEEEVQGESTDNLVDSRRTESTDDTMQDDGPGEGDMSVEDPLGGEENSDHIVQQFQVWRTRRKGRLELTHPPLDYLDNHGTLS